MRCKVALLGGLVLACACAKGDGDERGGIPYASGGPVGNDDAREEPEASSSDDTVDPGPAPHPPDAGTDEPDATTTDMPADESSDGAPTDDETTGMPTADPGSLPDDGPWSACAGASCDPGYACLEQTAGAGGVCTVPCVAAGDASACPDAPGDLVAPTCITVQTLPWCALDCSGGVQCPSGSTCTLDSDDAGPIAVCL